MNASKAAKSCAKYQSNIDAGCYVSKIKGRNAYFPNAENDRCDCIGQPEPLLADFLDLLCIVYIDWIREVSKRLGSNDARVADRLI